MGLEAPFDGNELTEWGNRNEPTIAKAFQDKTGLYVERCNVQLSHPFNPVFIAHIDRAVIESSKGLPRNRKTGAFNPEAGVLECKNVGLHSFRRTFGEGDSEIPLYYRAQVQWYLSVCGLRKGFLAVLVGGNHYEQYSVERDEADIAAMQEEAERFWRDYVVKGVPPPPRTAEDIARLFPRSTAKAKLASAEILEAVKNLSAIKAQAKALETEEAELSEAVKLYLADCDTLNGLDGKTLATWKSSKDSIKTNWQAIAQKLAEILAAPHRPRVEAKTIQGIIKYNTSTVAGKRPLLLKQSKGE